MCGTTKSAFIRKLTRVGSPTMCSVCLAAIVVIGLGGADIFAGGPGFYANQMQLVDQRRPGGDSDARRPSLERAFPETARDRQRPGYRPGYRPGAFERRAPRDCLSGRRSGSSDCK